MNQSHEKSRGGSRIFLSRGAPCKELHNWVVMWRAKLPFLHKPHNFLFCRNSPVLESHRSPPGGGCTFPSDPPLERSLVSVRIAKKKPFWSLDCSQSLTFPRDRRDIARLIVNGGRLDLVFDAHARWQPVTQSARSRRSWGKVGDCEQSILSILIFWFKGLNKVMVW